MTNIAHFLDLQSERSQVSSFSVSNSTRHAEEIGHTLHIFLGFETENRQVRSICMGSCLYLVLYGART